MSNNSESNKPGKGFSLLHIRQELGRNLERGRQARDAEATQTEEEEIPGFFRQLLSRRHAVPVIAGSTLAIAVAGAVGFELLTHPELFDALGIAVTNPDLASGANDLLHIINDQPSPQELREHITNRGRKIDLEEARQKVIANTNGAKTQLRVRSFALGDSNVYTDGTMHDGSPPDPQDQPNSFNQVAGDTMQPFLEEMGIASWETYTYAVPGAPSGDGYPTEKRKYGLLGPEQFYNHQFQEMMQGKEGEEDVLNIVTISATGDDWRMLMQNALALAHFFSNLKNIKQATQKDVEEFKALLAQSDSIAEEYGSHIWECLSQVAQINKERRAKGLLDVQVVLAQPLNMLGVKDIPFRTIEGNDDKVNALKDILIKVNNDPKDTRHYLDLTKIPYGNKIAYMITVAMYTQLSYWMKNTLGITPLPLEWMGLEEMKDFFFTDGHPGPKGTQMQAALLLNMMKAMSSSLGQVATLDTIAQVPPEIAQIVQTITHTV